jgi:hypothetical protein
MKDHVHESINKIASELFILNTFACLPVLTDELQSDGKSYVPLKRLMQVPWSNSGLLRHQQKSHAGSYFYWSTSSDVSLYNASSPFIHFPRSCCGGRGAGSRVRERAIADRTETETNKR